MSDLSHAPALAMCSALSTRWVPKSVPALLAVIVWPGLCLLAIVWAAPAVSAQPLNLLTNPNFDADTSGWTVSAGNWDSDSENEDPLSGSVYFDQPSAVGGQLLQCVQFPQPGLYEAFVHYRAQAGGTTFANQANRLLVFRFAGPDCQTDQLATEFFYLGDSGPAVYDTAGLWVYTGGRFEITAEVQSVVVYAIAAGGCDGVCETWIDRAFLGLVEPIFGDGFESGGTDAW